MSTITIFGTGNVGTAVGTLLADGGAEVEHINTSTSAPAVNGDIVVLAVPHAAVADIATRFADQLVGKIVVDATNPVDFTTLQLTPPADSSATAELARLLPDSAVLKAFNTNLAQTINDPAKTSVVLIAGDDESAKSTLAAAVEAGGLTAVDAGSLLSARELESFAFLQIQLAFGGKIAGFAVLPA